MGVNEEDAGPEGEAFDPNEDILPDDILDKHLPGPAGADSEADADDDDDTLNDEDLDEDADAEEDDAGDEELR